VIVTGIDPGGGSSSPTALVAFDPVGLSIFASEKLGSRSLHAFTKGVEEFQNFAPGDLVFIESFFIRGRGNQRLQQVIGALKAGVPDSVPIADVANTTMKKIVGGHGAAEKDTVAFGLLGYFAQNRESATLIADWIAAKEWDLTDALGIAVAGWHLHKLHKMEQANGEAIKAKPKKSERLKPKKKSSVR
jgi:Holliday junction resolvasome RuvABC endonuclease subunit